MNPLPPRPSTRDEFEAAYAARSNVTVERLHAWGRYAEPCNCDDPMCEGWQMTHTDIDTFPDERFTDLPGMWEEADLIGGETDADTHINQEATPPP